MDIRIRRSWDEGFEVGSPSYRVEVIKREGSWQLNWGGHGLTSIAGTEEFTAVLEKALGFAKALNTSEELFAIEGGDYRLVQGDKLI